MKYLAGLTLCIFSVCCHAEIYQSTDNSGNVIYSDTPSQNAKMLMIPRTDLPPSETPPLPGNKTAPVSLEQKVRLPYTVFQISSPKDQETIQNQPNIVVNIDVKPDLQSGDKIQIYVDGKPKGASVSSTSIDLGRLERGTHQFSAELLGEQNVIIKKSNPITVYIHYANTNTFPNIK